MGHDLMGPSPFENVDVDGESLTVMLVAGGSAAVVRVNIRAHERFGAACDGVLLFDADEFRYVEEEEKDSVPQELRALVDSAWIDPGSGDEDDGSADYAIAARFTDLVVTPQDVRRAVGRGYHREWSQTHFE